MQIHTVPDSIERFFWRYGVSLAVLVGLIARVVAITTMHTWTTVSAPFAVDDTLYIEIAKTLAETGELNSFHFPVGYPLFLALFLKLGSFALPAVRLVQLLLSLLTIVLVSRIAAVLYGNRASVIAAWLTALYPPLIYMSGRIMSETLFITLLMLSMYLFLLSDRDQNLKRGALAAAVFAIASLVRSNYIAILPIIPLWYLVRWGTSLHERLVRAVVCTTVAVIILMLPGLYFLWSKGEFIAFATNSGETFYCANNSLADGGCVDFYVHPEMQASIPREMRRSPAAYSKAQRDLGLKWISDNPGEFLSLLSKKFGNAWIPGFQTSQMTSRSTLVAVIQAMSVGLLLLGAIAGRILVKPASRDGILLAVPAVYTLMSLVFFGGPRYNLICAPVLVVYAAAWLARILPTQIRTTLPKSA